MFTMREGLPVEVMTLHVVAVKTKIVGGHKVTKYLLADGQVLTHDEWPLDQLKDTDPFTFVADCTEGLGWTRVA